jgi:peptidoglycan-N-acetylglucosamine deacetylase
MPGYGQMMETAERWRWMPGLEDLESGVALTFDDGEQLMKHHALAREALARGHDVGLHGFQHVRHDTLRGQARDDVARGLGTFEAAVGRKPRFFRPPYGAFNEYSYEACADLGLEPVYWSGWGFDWEAIAADRIASIVSGDLVDGAIILLHDSPRYAHRKDASATAEAVGLIAAQAAELGLTLGPLSELAPPRPSG